MKNFAIISTVKGIEEFAFTCAKNLNDAQIWVCDNFPKMVPGMNIIEVEDTSAVTFKDGKYVIQAKEDGDFLCMDIYTTAADLRFILEHPETVKEGDF